MRCCTPSVPPGFADTSHLNLRVNAHKQMSPKTCASQPASRFSASCRRHVPGTARFVNTLTATNKRKASGNVDASLLSVLLPCRDKCELGSTGPRAWSLLAMLRCEGTFTLHLHSAQALAAHATSSKQRPSVEALARFRIRTWVGQVSSECKDRDGRFALVTINAWSLIGCPPTAPTQQGRPAPACPLLISLSARHTIPN